MLNTKMTKCKDYHKRWELIQNSKILEVNQDFLTHNGVSKELFSFDNIRYYEELKPLKNNSIHNGKYVRIVFNKYLPDGITRICYDSIVMPKEFINFEQIQYKVVTFRKEA
tara:strand:- start:81 stop:413 length:333 start_codon:yes stop_codon:yes gene_type:complete